MVQIKEKNLDINPDLNSMSIEELVALYHKQDSMIERNEKRIEELKKKLDLIYY